MEIEVSIDATEEEIKKLDQKRKDWVPKPSIIKMQPGERFTNLEASKYHSVKVLFT
jgi:hypothetical protein